MHVVAVRNVPTKLKVTLYIESYLNFLVTFHLVWTFCAASTYTYVLLKHSMLQGRKQNAFSIFLLGHPVLHGCSPPCLFPCQTASQATTTGKNLPSKKNITREEVQKRETEREGGGGGNPSNPTNM